MRTALYRATCLAAALSAALFVPLALAQAPRASAPSSAPASGALPGANAPVAVVDVTYILDNYARLKHDTDAFKKDMENAEAALKKERDAIAKKAELLKTYKPGTPEFKKTEEEITKADSDWKLKVNRQKGDFAERDAKNFLSAYQALSQQVKLYAERNNISLVLRFNGARPDPANPQAVQMELSKMVMYYDKSVDITDPILAEMNRAAAVAAPPRGPAAPQRR
ncbi:MAG TPA: OmpH family outer membrane protein [Pirellulales bacterium]|nr:OmpH family outer membrane protein [Pirellulales bacterium]